MWVGRPPQGLLKWPCYSARVRGFAILALFLVIFPVLSFADPTLLDGDHTAAFLCAGLGLTLFLLILKGDADWRERTVYALTGTRALICRTDGRGTASSLPIPNKARLEREQNGLATIYIGEAPQAVMTIGIWDFSLEKQLVFRSVVDGARAYELVRNRNPAGLGRG